MNTATLKSPAGQREYLALAVLALPTILVALDISVLYIALPHVAADLHATGVQQLWITARLPGIQCVGCDPANGAEIGLIVAGRRHGTPEVPLVGTRLAR